jgi:hypothetical protein
VLEGNRLNYVSGFGDNGLKRDVALADGSTSIRQVAGSDGATVGTGAVI